MSRLDYLDVNYAAVVDVMTAFVKCKQCKQPWVPWEPTSTRDPMYRFVEMKKRSSINLFSSIIH